MTYHFNPRANAELSNEQLYRIAPSIFATEKHESRSDRFQPIPTIDVLEGLRKEGFVPVRAQQSTTRDPGKAPFTKHAVRLRSISDAGRKLAVGDTFFEIVLRNGNDGTSAYHLNAGLFRLACLNGMTVADRTIDRVSVRHSGNVGNKVIEGTFRVLDQAELALSAPADWSRIQLPLEAQHALAEAAHAIRFGDDATPIRPQQLLNARRFEDRGDSLWQVWNRTQENVIRGGLTAWNASTNRRTTTREVKGIDSDTRLNKALWLVGEQLADTLKKAAA